MQKIDNAIFDFDGVFYRYNFLGTTIAFDEMVVESLKKTIPEIFPTKGIEEHNSLVELCIDDFEEYLDLITTGQTPFDAHTTKQQSQSLYHKNLYAMVSPYADKLTAEAKALKEDFYAIRDKGVTFGVLSLADDKEWITPHLKDMALHSAFDYIIDYQGTNFIYKGMSPEPVTQAIAAAHSTSDKSVFIEDNITNIKVAKEKYSDLQTIWINTKSEVAPSEVTYSVPNLKSALLKLDHIT